MPRSPDALNSPITPKKQNQEIEPFQPGAHGAPAARRQAQGQRPPKGISSQIMETLISGKTIHPHAGP